MNALEHLTFATTTLIVPILMDLILVNAQVVSLETERSIAQVMPRQKLGFHV